MRYWREVLARDESDRLRAAAENVARFSTTIEPRSNLASRAAGKNLSNLTDEKIRDIFLYSPYPVAGSAG